MAWSFSSHTYGKVAILKHQTLPHQIFDYKASSSRSYCWPGVQTCSLQLCAHTCVHCAGSVQLSCCGTDNHRPSIFLFPFFPHSSKYLCRAFYQSLSRYKSLKQFASNFRVVAQPCSALPYFWATAVLYWMERRRLKEWAKKTPLPHSDVLNIQEKCRYLKCGLTGSKSGFEPISLLKITSFQSVK